MIATSSGVLCLLFYWEAVPLAVEVALARNTGHIGDDVRHVTCLVCVGVCVLQHSVHQRGEPGQGER